MSIRNLQNSDAEKLEQFLSDYAETSMFLRSNMKRSGLEYQDKEYHGEYFGAFDETGNVTGVLAQYWNGSIMMQAQSQVILGALITAFREAVTRPVTGISGADEQAKFVIDELSLSGETFAMNSAGGLYALELDALSLPANIDFTSAQMIDVCEVNREVLTLWIKAYEIAGLGSENSQVLDKRVENRIDRTMNDKNCWALQIEGKPVSLSGFNARLPDIVQIGPVWTPPEYRNRGYARVLVALSLQKAREQGVEKAILFTDNPAAVKVYEALGFERIGSY
ncbi:MAG: GNAT family N-acetyltransferase, partial [Desulfobulbia bacterium]